MTKQNKKVTSAQRIELLEGVIKESDLKILALEAELASYKTTEGPKSAGKAKKLYLLKSGDVNLGSFGWDDAEYYAQALTAAMKPVTLLDGSRVCTFAKYREARYSSLRAVGLDLMAKAVPVVANGNEEVEVVVPTTELLEGASDSNLDGQE